MAEPQNLDVPFPLGGVDVSGAFADQLANTAAVGVNCRAIDPILERQRGGSRPGLSKYGDQIPEGPELIQHLNQIVILRDDNLLANVDYGPDWIPDPNNPDRFVPPNGSGSQPSRNWPPGTYRRVSLVADHTVQTNGQNVILTATLIDQNDDPVSGATITLSTNPAGQDGTGDSGVTNGSGVTTFTVTEPTFNGSIVYFATHQYTRSGQAFPSLARGFVTVAWKPNYTLTLASPQGLSFLANGKSHPLVGSLINNQTLLPVSGKKIQLQTIPSQAVGDGGIKITNVAGKGTWPVSDTVVESVQYQAFLLPQRFIDSDPVTILWTGNTCNQNISGTAPTLHTEGEAPISVAWWVTWTSVTIPPTVPTTHIKMFINVFTGIGTGRNCGNIQGVDGIPLASAYDDPDVTCINDATTPITGDYITALLLAQDPVFVEFLAGVQSNACA